MIWGDEAAERHEMDELSDPLAVDGTPRLNPIQQFYADEEQARAAISAKQAKYVPRWAGVFDQAVELAEREAALQRLLAYLQAEGTKKAHSQASAYRRNAYADAAGRLLKILEGEA